MRARSSRCVVVAMPASLRFLPRVGLPLAAAVGAGFADYSLAQVGIVNGDFTTPVPRNGTGGGWTSTHIDQAGGWFSEGGNPGGMFLLNDAGEPDTDPTLTQLVAGLNPGTTYLLTGQFASHYANESPCGGLSFEVRVDGVLLLQAMPGPLDVWRSFGVMFQAMSTQAVIEVRAETNGTDNDFKVDNFDIEVTTSVPPTCYPNCDGSTTPPVLNVNDFLCFQARFAAGDSYANCDGSTVCPVLNINDFICFQGAFAAGCP